ncbi:MAG: hypothetical protein ACRDFB_03020 [Rhabdochlamydiaceae bacterium]
MPELFDHLLNELRNKNNHVKFKNFVKKCNETIYTDLPQINEKSLRRTLTKSEIKKIIEHNSLVQKVHQDVERTIAIFDLKGSTDLTNKKSHNAGVRSVLDHHNICSSIISMYGGIVMKGMGDGVLSIFEQC